MQNCKKPIGDEDGADRHFRGHDNNCVGNSRPQEQLVGTKRQNQQAILQSEEGC